MEEAGSFRTAESYAQAIIALCLPMAMTAIPEGGLPLLVMLMCIAWAANQISPTHVCTFVAARFYGTTLGDLVEPGKYIAAPTTSEEMDESIRYMLSNNQNTLTLRYSNISPLGARKVMDQALSIVKSYVEQCYNAVTCNYTNSGTVTLTFSAANVGDRIQTYRESAMAAAISVHDELWSTGQITAGMTEY